MFIDRRSMNWDSVLSIHIYMQNIWFNVRSVFKEFFSVNILTKEMRFANQYSRLIPKNLDSVNTRLTIHTSENLPEPKKLNSNFTSLFYVRVRKPILHNIIIKLVERNYWHWIRNATTRARIDFRVACMSHRWANIIMWV